MILDLSAVTDGLINLMSSAWSSAPIWAELPAGSMFVPKYTGLAPDAIRNGSDTWLSLFLYHVETDNAREATFWSPEILSTGGQPIQYLPLALDLYYLLSSYSEGNYAHEQQAMSVALRIFHANAIVRSPTNDSQNNPFWYLTLTMEHRSYDELSRLWQATTVPLRLGVVYRAAVVFLSPEQAGAAPEQVTTLNTYVNTIGSRSGGDVVTITKADVEQENTPT